MRMRSRVVVIAVCAPMVLCACKSPGARTGGTTAQSELANGREAREWLKGNANESGLASNRFGLTANAREFVEQLYAAGAERVIVPGSCVKDDSETIKLEGGPYADCLSVFLPKDPGKRAAVLQMCRLEIEREGFDPPDDSAADDFVFLWWD